MLRENTMPRLERISNFSRISQNNFIPLVGDVNLCIVITLLSHSQNESSDIKVIVVVFILVVFLFFLCF